MIRRGWFLGRCRIVREEAAAWWFAAPRTLAGTPVWVSFQAGIFWVMVYRRGQIIR